MINRQNIAKNLKLLCTQKCITNSKMCEITGISRPTLIKIMNGDETIQESTLKKVAIGLHMTLNELSEDSANMLEISENQEKLGRNIMALLFIQAIPQRELLDECNIHIGAVKKMINGETHVRVTTIGKIANFFGVSVYDLMNEDYSKKADSLSFSYLKDNLLRICNERKIQLAMLPFISGISNKTIQGILKGEKHLRSQTLKKLASALDVSIETLLTCPTKQNK